MSSKIIRSINRFFSSAALAYRKKTRISDNDLEDGSEAYEGTLKVFDNVLLPIIIGIVVWSYFSFFSVVIFND